MIIGELCIGIYIYSIYKASKSSKINTEKYNYYTYL